MRLRTFSLNSKNQSLFLSYAYIQQPDYFIPVLFPVVWMATDPCGQVFDIVCMKRSSVPTQSRASAKQINVLTFALSPIHSHTQTHTDQTTVHTAYQTITYIHPHTHKKIKHVFTHTQVCVSLRLSTAPQCPNQSERGRPAVSLMHLLSSCTV